MQLTYRGQIYTSTPVAAAPTTTPAATNPSYTLRYRGVTYTH